MPPVRSQSLSKAHVRSWADNIPLGSLEQLQKAGRDSLASLGAYPTLCSPDDEIGSDLFAVEATSIEKRTSLLTSKASSLYPENEAGQNASRESLLTKQDESASSVDSLAQLEAAQIPENPAALLPSGKDNYTTSIDSLAQLEGAQGCVGSLAEPPGSNSSINEASIRPLAAGSVEKDSSGRSRTSSAIGPADGISQAPPQQDLGAPSNHTSQVATLMSPTSKGERSLRSLSSDNVSIVEPSGISLPPSASRTDVHSSELASLRHPSQISLPCSYTGTTRSVDTKSTRPSAVALPSSRSSTSGDRHADSAHGGTPSHANTSITPSAKSREYWLKVTSLAPFLPHLNSIMPSRGRHKNVGRLQCIDYYDDGSRRYHRTIGVKDLIQRNALYGQLEDFRSVEQPKLVSRIVLVEDLSPELIAAVGHVFEVDPECFAEHLNQSGYNGLDYDDIDPARWAAWHTTKRHASVTWFRPVRQYSRITDWLKDPRSLLDKGTIPDGKGKRTVLSTKTWSDQPYDSHGRPRGHAMDHRAYVDTNIFRNSWTLSAGPTAQDDPRSTSSGLSDSGTLGSHQSASSSSPSVASSQRDTLHYKSDLVPTAWQERATFFPYAQARVPIGLLFIDPLPSVTDHTTPLHERKKRGIRTGSMLTRAVSESVPMALPMVPRLPNDMPQNKYLASDKEVKTFGRSLDVLDSTRKVIATDKISRLHKTFDKLQADSILALLRLIETDSMAFFRSLEWTLDDISQDSLDDFLMTRRSSDWRKLMSDFEIRVPAIGKQVEAFVSFVFLPEADRRVPDEAQEIIDRINKEIYRIKERLGAAYTGLRADMQFTESRRSITETKTVTRLTELAFIFIPLSFCASLFSMDIRELENGGPVWTFIVTALVMVSVAYAVRLFIGSEFLVNSTRRSLEKFWEERGLRRGANAPLFTIVLLTIQDLWNRGGRSLSARAAAILLVAAFPVVPIAVMWLYTGMGTGFHAAITLLFILPMLAGAALWLYLERRDLRSWTPRSDSSEDTDSGEEV